MLHFCASFIFERLGKVATETPIVLVVSLLLALMQDQSHKLRQVPGAKPLLLSEESAPEEGDMAVGGWTHVLPALRLCWNPQGGESCC